MPEVENSEVVRHVLQTLMDISRRKTTAGHAIFVMDSLMRELEKKYDFLKHVEIKDTRYLEAYDPITVMTDIDTVKSHDLGAAIRDIIMTMNSDLGKDAGHFFIKEVRNNIEDEYHLTIEEMGVDLGLMQLEFEVNEMERRLRTEKK